MSDILPAIDGTIAISITDPIKNDQGKPRNPEVVSTGTRTHEAKPTRNVLASLLLVKLLKNLSAPTFF